MESPKPKFKNKSERNAGYESDASKIFKNKQLLLERPEGMSREEYQFLRKTQTLILKNLFRKSPLRKLQGIMGVGKQQKFSTTKGYRKMVKQRKSS